MRIVSGKHRSRVLKSLKGDNTRPTSDKIRGAIFDSIAFDGNYKTMLDLFSGSGAMGIEALSRGFEFVVFNDNSKQAVNIIKENIKSVDLIKQSKVYALDYRKCLKLMKGSYTFDLIFIDPPYDKIDVSEIIELISTLQLLNDEGIIIVEGSNHLKLSDEIANFKLYKEKDYKSTLIKYYEKS